MNPVTPTGLHWRELSLTDFVCKSGLPDGGSPLFIYPFFNT